mgnify:CR=1 FL=1
MSIAGYCLSSAPLSSACAPLRAACQSLSCAMSVVPRLCLRLWLANHRVQHKKIPSLTYRQGRVSILDCPRCHLAFTKPLLRRRFPGAHRKFPTLAASHLPGIRFCALIFLSPLRPTECSCVLPGSQLPRLSVSAHCFLSIRFFGPLFSCLHPIPAACPDRLAAL